MKSITVVLLETPQREGLIKSIFKILGIMSISLLIVTVLCQIGWIYSTTDIELVLEKYNYAAIVTINGTNYQQVVSTLRSFILLFIISSFIYFFLLLYRLILEVLNCSHIIQEAIILHHRMAHLLA